MSSYGYKTKEALREHYKQNKPDHISYDEFTKIAEKSGTPNNKLEFVLSELNILGMCLNYDGDGLDDLDTYVLNPDWIANGIYTIINMGRREGDGRNKHLLTIRNGVEILKKAENYKYTQHNVKFLFRLMRKYELAYFKTDECICVPLILPLDQPKDLPKFDSNQSLTMSFEVDHFLPPNIVSRLIVHRSDHNEIYDE